MKKHLVHQHIIKNLDRLKLCRFITFPINVNESHWVLSVADLHEKKLYMVDSFDYVAEAHGELVAHIHNYVRHLEETLVGKGHLAYKKGKWEQILLKEVGK